MAGRVDLTKKLDITGRVNRVATVPPLTQPGTATVLASGLASTVAPVPATPPRKTKPPRRDVRTPAIQLMVYVLPELAQQWRAAARQDGMSVGAFMLQAIEATQGKASAPASTESALGFTIPAPRAISAHIGVNVRIAKKDRDVIDGLVDQLWPDDGRRHRSTFIADCLRRHLNDG